MHPASPTRIAIVDDEAGIRTMVSEFFEADGYFVLECAGGHEIDALLAEHPVDIILLDLCMPGEDGLSVARRLRAAGAPPIIMLTSLCDMVDRVVGLEVGADDYLGKPFDLRELKARMRAVLRRRAEAAAPAPARQAAPGRTVRFGEVELDLEKGHLRDPDGRHIGLTPSELDMLMLFARHPNRVLSRESLRSGLAGCEGEAGDRAVDIRVTRVRRKIEADHAKPRVIRTVRGAGYVFVVQPRL